MSERIAYYTDEHVALAVVFGLRLRGVDVITAQDADLLSADDQTHFTFAQQLQRVIITQDDDFIRFHASGLEHHGIIYAPQHTSISALIRGVMLVYEVLSPSDMRNHIEFI